MADHLFTGTSILDLVESRKAAARHAVASLGRDYLLNASEEDLIASLIDEFRLNVPVLDETGIHVSSFGETPVDVSRDPNRLIYDRGRPVYVQGTGVTVVVPFQGDADLFTVRPQTYSMNPPRGQVSSSELQLSFTRLDHDAEALKREYMTQVTQIQSALQNLRSAAAHFNGELPTLLRQQVQARKTKLLADAGLAASLGLPIRRREDAPPTYIVPLTRKTPRIERPAAPTAPFRPEPELSMTEYETILSILRNMVLVMERSPSAFETMTEEDLRTHFLVQLNAQYEGKATAETFNHEGKTDIFLNVDGRNVFIAECKFWRGEKHLLAAIDQALSYLSWRDTKVAILVFNRNANFTNVLNAIEDTVPNHAYFKRFTSKPDESTFRYVFHQPDDANREVVLTVTAFNVPRPQAKTNGEQADAR